MADEYEYPLYAVRTSALTDAVMSGKYLQEYYNILSPTSESRFLYPLWESNPGAGGDVQDFGEAALHATNVVAFDNVPYIRGGMLAYRLNATDEYLNRADAGWRGCSGVRGQRLTCIS